jgi:hypothetical protein
VLEDLSPSNLCFAGKEPFLNRQSARLVHDTVALRNQLQPQKQTQIGVITNGTRVHRYRKLIEQAPPDYLDVSVDGLPPAHDAVRGEGAFEMLAPNLRWLSHVFKDSLWLTHTLMATNLANLPEFVSFFNRTFGIQNFSLGIYKSLPQTDSTLAMPSDSLAHELDAALSALGDTTLKTSVRVVMDIDMIHEGEADFLERKGWFNESATKGTFKTVADRQFNNGVNLQMMVAGFPVGLWHAVRITPEGFWLAAEDMIHPMRYEELAVGKLQDYDFDARRLYEEGLRSDRLQELFSEADDTELSLLPALKIRA